MFTLPAFLLQTSSGLTPNQTMVLLIFAGVITVAVVVQCLLLISFAAGSAKATKEIVSLVREIESKASPLMESATRVVETAGPKIQRAASNFAEVSEIARSKAIEIDSLTTEMVMRARQQGRRVDGIVSDTLTGVENVRGQLHHALLAPVRQVSSIVAGVKAALDKLKSRGQGERFSNLEREEMFGEGDDYHA